MKCFDLEMLLNPFNGSQAKPSAAAIVILAALIAFQILSGAIWIASDCRLMGNDETDYLQNGLRHKFSLQHKDHEFSDYFQRFLGYQEITSTPPLLFDLWEIAWLIFGTNPEAARGFSLFSLVLAGIFSFAAARKLGGDIAGLIACTTLFSFPPAIFFSHHASSFAPHLAAVACVCFVIITYDLGRKPGCGLLLGLAVSADILMERGTPVIILAPMLLFTVAVVFMQWRRKKSPISSQAMISIMVAGAIIVALCWAYISGYLEYNMEHTVDLALSPLSPGRQGNYYTNDFYRLSLTPPITALFALSLLILLFNRRMGAYRIFFALAFFIPIWLFSNLATRDLEYVFGTLPIAAIAVGVGLTSIKRIPRWPLVIGLAALIYFGLAYNTHLSFGTYPNESWPGRASLRWKFKPQLPSNIPDIRRMAAAIDHHYPDEPLGILYIFGGMPFLGDKIEGLRTNLTHFNALQIYMASRRPDSVHIFILSEVGQQFFPRPKNAQAIYAVPLRLLFGKIRGIAGQQFHIDSIEGGLFHYGNAPSEKPAVERFMMTKPTPVRPALILGSRVLLYDHGLGR